MTVTGPQAQQQGVEIAIPRLLDSALSASVLDPRACRDGLADHDIRDLCK